MSNAQEVIRLPDPFTHPGEAPGFLSAPLIDNEPIIQDELPGGTVKQVKSAQQYWSTVITYADLYDMEFRLVSSAVYEAKRKDGLLQIVLPQYTSYRVFGNTANLSIPANQKGSSLTIQGFNSVEGVPYVGDLFKLSTHPKVYKITKVTRAGDSVTLGLYPNLVITTNGTEKPELNGVTFQMALTNRSGLKENINPDGMYTDVTISLRESL